MLFRSPRVGTFPAEVAPPTFLFRRVVKNGREVAPHDFLFRRKSASEKWQGGRATPFPFSPKIRESAPFVLRSRHTPAFFAKNPRVGTFASAAKGIPCAFSPIKGLPREHNARNMRAKTRAAPTPDCTAPRPFSPSLMRLAYDP